jgi:hypothetical protein
MAAYTSPVEQCLDRRSDSLHLSLELGTTPCVVSDPMAIAEAHLADQQDEAFSDGNFSDGTRRAAVFREALEGAQQVRPAKLSVTRCMVCVGAPGIAAKNSSEFSKTFLGAR